MFFTFIFQLTKMFSTIFKLCLLAGVLALAYSAPHESQKDIGRNRRSVDSTIVMGSAAFINSISSHFHSSQNKDVIAVLGLPGAGKTTLLNFLSKPISSLTAVNNNGKFYITSSDHKDEPYEDFMPIEFADESNRVFYELPSFRDEYYNSSTKFSNAYFNKKVFDDANKIKIVFPFSHSKLETEFTKLIENAEKLIPDFDVFKNSISLIVTKVNNIVDSDDVIITNIAKSLKDMKSRVGDKQNWIKFIDIVTTEKDSKYPNIGLFKRPSKAGTLDLDSDMQASKQSLLHIVHENSQFVTSEKSATRYSDNEEVKEILNEIVKELVNLSG